MPGIYSLAEALMNSTEENIKDDPSRFRFSLPSVDRMAILSPGSVIGVVATSTGQGKTTFVLQETLEAARKYGEVVLNYQAELTIEQVARIVTAHTLRKHRLELTPEDMKSAAHALGNTKYYVGRNAALTTITPVLDLMEAAIRRLSPTVAVLDNIHYLVRNETDQVKAMENAMQRVKSMAVLYGLKFFVLGAPKKAESTAKGKQLHVSDVRGSIAFGDDSDAVFTIHRDMLTNSDDRKNDYSPATRLRLVKVRDKGPGDADVDLIFLGEIATFAEAARANEPSYLTTPGKHGRIEPMIAQEIEVVSPADRQKQEQLLDRVDALLDETSRARKISPEILFRSELRCSKLIIRMLGLYGRNRRTNTSSLVRPDLEKDARPSTILSRWRRISCPTFPQRSC